MTILNPNDTSPSARVIRVENCQIAYPHLWQPFGQDRKAYSVQCILDQQVPEHAQAMQEIVRLTGMFLQENNIDPQYASQMSPLKEGSVRNRDALAQGRTARPEIEGKFVVNASDTRYAPQVYDQNKQLMTEAQSANIFGGCICNVVFNLYWFNAPQNRGVAAGLKMVQLLNNVGVTRFGGDNRFSEEQASAYLVDVPPAPGGAPQTPPWAFPGQGPAPLSSTPQNAGPMPSGGAPQKMPWEM